MEIWQNRSPYLEVEQTGRTALVRFCSSQLIESEAVEGIGRKLSTLVEKSGAVNLLLNTAPVEQVSSPLISLLVRLQTEVHVRGGQVLFCNVQPRFYQQLEALRLHTFFAIYHDEEEARQALG
jgi:anti-anti-sigma factor